MAGLVDIHSHILPGIDDGPEDVAGSLAMARAAVGAGIERLAATPHLRADFPGVDASQIPEQTASLQQTLDAEGTPLALVAGAEVGLTWALDATEKELRLASYAQRGTDLLIETPSTNVVAMGHMLYGLRAKGYRITLAHPERNPGLQRDPSPLVELVHQGVLLQINAESLLARGHRSGPGALAERLCTDGMAHVLASDGHRGEDWRPVTRLAEAVELGTSLLGVARAQWLVQDAPAAILAGEPLPDPPAVRPERPRRRWFGRN